MFDFRAGAEKVQDEPGTFFLPEKKEISKSDGYMLAGTQESLEGFLLAKSINYI